MASDFRFIFVDERVKSGNSEVRERLTPKRASLHSSGFDLASSSLEPIVLKKGERALVSTGIAIAMRGGYEAQVRPRSGLALKHGITVLNAPGTIDADYRGEVKVILVNHGDQDFCIEFGMRIAQLVIARVELPQAMFVDQLDETERGEQGFGSSGVN